MKNRARKPPGAWEALQRAQNNPNIGLNNCPALYMAKKARLENGLINLMQINFLFNILSLSKEKRDDLFTDMSFLAQKKGREFGPFGKLY